MVTSEESEIIKLKLLPIFPYFMPTFSEAEPKTRIPGHSVGYELMLGSPYEPLDTSKPFRVGLPNFANKIIRCRVKF